MLKKLALLVGVAVVCCCVASCSDSPSSPEAGRTVDDLWFDGGYDLYPASARDQLESGAALIVHEGAGTGPTVDDITVIMNADTLSYNPTTERYEGVVPGLLEGDDLTITLIDGTSWLSKTLTVPYAPTNLSLSNNTWDFSSGDAENVLMWDNPQMLGQYLVVLIWDNDGATRRLMYYDESDEVTSTSKTIQTSELWYTSPPDEVMCVVWQKNQIFLPDQCGGSFFIANGGVSQSYPTSQ
jgi:hypothetical protein